MRALGLYMMLGITGVVLLIVVLIAVASWRRKTRRQVKVRAQLLAEEAAPWTAFCRLRGSDGWLVGIERRYNGQVIEGPILITPNPIQADPYSPETIEVELARQKAQTLAAQANERRQELAP